MRSEKQAFTLIELMVVISVIAILMGISFKLMRAASHDKQIAETRLRMERIQNALSGYYAYYGHYPNVKFYYDLDPAKITANYGASSMSGMSISGGGGAWELQAELAARSQPMTFLFPTQGKYPATYIPDMFKRIDMDVKDINHKTDSITRDMEDWSQLRAFQFGLMSYLLPRIELMEGGKPADRPGINPTLYKNLQWIENNPGTPRDFNDKGDFERKVRALWDAQNEVAAKWLPHLEGTVKGTVGWVMGIDVHLHDGGGSGGPLGNGMIPLVLSSRDSDLVALGSATCWDAWGNEFYYYSPPPYQSYIIWSAGPDRKTFPPWIDSNSEFYKAHKDDIIKRIKDDIVGGSL